jgi:hypothetical protein
MNGFIADDQEGNKVSPYFEKETDDSQQLLSR